MSRLCIVNNCVNSKTNASGNDRRKKVSFFQLPKDERRTKWLESAKGKMRISRSKNDNYFFCEKHFEKCDLITNIKNVQNTSTIKKKVLNVKSNAIPSIFGCDEDIGDHEVHNEIPSNIQLPIQDVTNSLQKESSEYNPQTNFHSIQVKQTENLDLANYDINALKQNLNSDSMQCGFFDLNEGIMICLIDKRQNSEVQISKAINIKKDMSYEIHINGQRTPTDCQNRIESFKDFRTLVQNLREKKICTSIFRPNTCAALLKSKSKFCKPCNVQRRKRIRAQNKENIRMIRKKIGFKKKVRNLKGKVKRLSENIQTVNDEIERIRDECSSKTEEYLQEAIKNLPKIQQTAIQNCHQVAKCASKNGSRYTLDWVYECLLLRIKSRKAYDHIRVHNILPVPTFATLNKYLRALKPMYGYRAETFASLQQKSQNMLPVETRGVIVADEMKLTEAIHFDKNDMKFHGFTNLGNYTPDQQQNQPGDHALVIMFQPFRGNWVQTLGAFISRGCANSFVLHKLILEGIILMEMAGFQVDGVVTDGANWNRAMWKRFGVTGSSTTCTHPYDENRELFFISDFSHLDKNFRNFIISQEEHWTPDGVIKLKHWRAVVERENPKSLSLKCAFKLTENHIKPKGYSKMNVALATEFFHENVAAAMKIHKDNGVPELQDCEPTIQFINRVNKLILAMTSRTPLNALSFDSESYKIIKDFLQYLKTWEDECEKKNYIFLTSNTSYGLKVTLTNTIKLMEYLTNNHDFKYLMTARLNQDGLESFFGMARDACGSNEHPDPLQFIQVYRLLSVYSLIKPPKGSNVTGVELFENLVHQQRDGMLETAEEKLIWEKVLDSIVENGLYKEYDENSESSNVSEKDNFDTACSSEAVVNYVAGFISRKVEKWTTCDACIATVVRTEKESNQTKDQMIEILNRGYLKYPSDNLFLLLKNIEDTIMANVTPDLLNAFIFIETVEKINITHCNKVGCTLHQNTLTKSLLNYYLTMRAQMIAKSYNKIFNENREKSRARRKEAKLL